MRGRIAHLIFRAAVLDAAPPLSFAAPSGRGLSHVALCADGTRPSVARSHDAVPAWQHLDLTLRRVPRRAGLHLIINSTGLSIVGEGELAAAKHGGRGRRSWKKLHLGVDQLGVIAAHALTDATVDDANTGIDLIETVDVHAAKVIADAAYDTVAFYDAASAQGATVVVPPAKTATVSRRNPRSSVRDRTINTVKRIGRCRWRSRTLPSASASRERVLPVQVHHRRCSSSPDTWWANGRSAARVQHTERDDRHGAPSLLRHRPMKQRWLEPWRASFDSCTNACAGKARSRGTRCRDVIFETLFATLWVTNPIRPRSAASRNRVMRGPGVTQGAKRSQGARRPRE